MSQDAYHNRQALNGAVKARISLPENVSHTLLSYCRHEECVKLPRIDDQPACLIEDILVSSLVIFESLAMMRSPCIFIRKAVFLRIRAMSSILRDRLSMSVAPR